MHQYCRLVLADLRDCLVQSRREIEAAAFPISRQVLSAGFDSAFRINPTRAADAMNGAKRKSSFFARPIRRRSIFVNPSIASSRFSLSSPCRHSSNFHTLALDNWIPVEIELDDAGSNVGTSNIYG